MVGMDLPLSLSDHIISYPVTHSLHHTDRQAYIRAAACSLLLSCLLGQVEGRYKAGHRLPNGISDAIS